ncbi:MAG: toll/interleukin-1 receptor domain-containing protein [Hyphomicrobiaceae bacterium]
MTYKKPSAHPIVTIAKSATGDRRALLREAARAGKRRGGRADALPRVAAQPLLPAAALGRHADVFISYSREDITAVGELVAHLRQCGMAVRWDQDFDAGDDFEKAIREMIAGVKAVIVVWSKASAASPFVRDEAKLAFAAGKLVTLSVPGFAAAEVPLGLGHLNVIDIADHERVARSLAKHGIPQLG